MDEKKALATTTPTAIIPLEAEVSRAREFRRGAKASSTRRAYDHDWAMFVEWCEKRGGEAVEASPEAVATYLSTLFHTPRVRKLKNGEIATRPTSISLVQRTYAGILHFLRATKNPIWKMKHDEITEVLASARRNGPAVTQKRAIVGEDRVRELVDGCPADLQGRRDRLILLVGFLGAFRRSELVAIDVAHITFTLSGVEIYVPKSKTDQEGKGRIVGIPFNNTSLCAATALREWISANGLKKGPIFRPVERSVLLKRRLTPEMVAETVKRAYRNIGLPDDDFAGHSLRAGFVTTASKAGKSLKGIMQQTGHMRPDTVLKYIRNASIFDDNAADGLFKR